MRVAVIYIHNKNLNKTLNKQINTKQNKQQIDK